MTMSRRERVAAFAFLAAVALLRLVLVFRYRLDSDEPQLLHVTWGWTHGLVQYRDVFDEHMPLLQLLAAPLLLAVGERPAALFAMRLLMLPLYALMLWSVHRLGRAVAGPRAAVWGTVVAALAPGFVLCSLEFRTEALCVALWFSALATLVGGPPTPGRGFAAGLLVGAAGMASQRAGLVLVALLVAAAATRVPGRRAADDLRLAAASLAGVGVVPLAVAAAFAALGGLAPFLANTVLENVSPVVGISHRWPWRVLAFLAGVGGVLASARLVAVRTTEAGLRARRTFVVVVTGVYVVLLFTLWPLRGREDYMAAYPLLAVLLTPLVVEAGLRGAPRAAAVVPAVVVSALLAGVVAGGRPWTDETAPSRALVADVLRLTAPDEAVLDAKGESLFRPREMYPVLDTVTHKRFARGILRDDIAAQMMTAGTCVFVGDSSKLPPAARQFVEGHYVRVASYGRVGELRVCGARLGDRRAPGDTTLAFEVALPAAYAIATDGRPPSGTLDGTSYVGPRRLLPGRHAYAPGPEEGSIVVVWARALERGFSPFGARRAGAG